MGVKLIAIGSRLMGDDGVAILVAEVLRPALEQMNVQVIIGETDTGYSASQVAEGDTLLILDAMYSGSKPGTVTTFPLEIVKVNLPGQFPAHQSGVQTLLNLCPFPLSGSLIGIEVADVRFSLELSQTLAAQFDAICKEVLERIRDMLANK